MEEREENLRREKFHIHIRVNRDSVYKSGVNLLIFSVVNMILSISYIRLHKFFVLAPLALSVTGLLISVSILINNKDSSPSEIYVKKFRGLSNSQGFLTLFMIIFNIYFSLVDLDFDF